MSLNVSNFSENGNQDFLSNMREEYNSYNFLQNKDDYFRLWKDNDKKKVVGKNLIGFGFILFLIIVIIITTLFSISSRINPDLEGESKQKVYYLKMGSKVSYVSEPVFWSIIGVLSLFGISLITFLFISLLKRNKNQPIQDNI
jgi:hypothetical protein